jgi:acyl-CoA synthetase (AMP-forming)/AMP-acid ligase II
MSNVRTLDIEMIITNENKYRNDDVDLDRLSTVAIVPESIALVIFTSGTTGVPKAVSF